jgi:CBS domain-containing protein/mannitol/fructose-specific phosphotransferase system IIA component (Ntr-type)
MNLRDFLNVDQVVVPLRSDSLSGAADVLVDRLSIAGAVRDADKLRRRIAEERAEDIVAMHERAFVLHYRTDAVSELRVALGVSAEPLPRDDGEDRQRARVVLLVVAPPRHAARQLQVVRGFARLLSRPKTVELIVAEDKAQDIAALPLFGEYTLPEQLTVRDLMTERPRTTSPELPLRDAARELLQAGLSALPVVDDDGRLLGMLSERELMRHLLATAVLSSPSSRHSPPGLQGRMSVRDVMTRQVLCVAPEQSVAEVASLMANKDVERVPVVREGRLVGFLTRGDIVRKLIGP